jgi:hypothetical protein
MNHTPFRVGIQWQQLLCRSSSDMLARYLLPAQAHSILS